MPQDVGYSFIEFELEKVANELAQMQGIPTTPESLQSIKQAIMQNPALGANTPTGKEIAAQGVGDPGTQALVQEDPSFVPADFEAPGAKDALTAFMQQMSPDDAPIDMGGRIPPGQAQGQPVDVGPGSFTGVSLDGSSGSNNNRGPTAVGSGSGGVEQVRKQGPQARGTGGNQEADQVTSGTGIDLMSLIAMGAPVGAAAMLSSFGNNYIRPPSTPNGNVGNPIQSTDMQVDNTLEGEVIPRSNAAGEIGQESNRTWTYNEPPKAVEQQAQRGARGGTSKVNLGAQSALESPETRPLDDLMTYEAQQKKQHAPNDLTPIRDNSVTKNEGSGIIDILLQASESAKQQGDGARAKAILNAIRALR